MSRPSTTASASKPPQPSGSPSGSSGWLRRFVSDPSGRVVIAQPPNFPLIAWAATGLAGFLLPDGRPQDFSWYLSAAFLFVWAYLEISDGTSPIRRVMGALVLIVLLIRAWTHA